MAESFRYARGVDLYEAAFSWRYLVCLVQLFPCRLDPGMRSGGVRLREQSFEAAERAGQFGFVGPAVLALQATVKNIKGF